jgi:hypothetical protein
MQNRILMAGVVVMVVAVLFLMAGAIPVAHGIRPTRYALTRRSSTPIPTNNLSLFPPSGLPRERPL